MHVILTTEKDWPLQRQEALERGCYLVAYADGWIVYEMA